MIAVMSTVYMNEHDVARDFAAVLEKIRTGVEVVVEHDRQPVAVIRSARPQGRRLSECIALAEARGATAIPDADFMRDVEEGIKERSKPWKPPSWE